MVSVLCFANCRPITSKGFLINLKERIRRQQKQHVQRNWNSSVNVIHWIQQNRWMVYLFLLLLLLLLLFKIKPHTLPPIVNQKKKECTILKPCESDVVLWWNINCAVAQWCDFTCNTMHVRIQKHQINDISLIFVLEKREMKKKERRKTIHQNAMNKEAIYLFCFFFFDTDTLERLQSIELSQLR